MKPTPDMPVLPKPQKIALGGGGLKRTSFRSITLRGPLPRSLRKHFQEFAEQRGLVRGRPGKGSIIAGLNPVASPSHPEGYVLEVGDRIMLSAGHAAGLFYGLQTLRQLFDACPMLPRCTIEDWPALALRGFYFDLTRQAPTTDFLKLIVDRLAAVKINTLMIQYREFFPYEGFPLIVSKHAYTPKQFAEFVRYAHERCIQVIPLLQSMSFQEHILRAQAYAHLREKLDDVSCLCPTHPGSFRLYRSLAEQLIAAHPGVECFHLGADEANTVGQCERCKRALAKGSRATLVAGFANKIIRFLLDRGVKPMMWADMLFGHFEDRDSVSRYVRDMFGELSRDVIAADWDYWSTGPKNPPAHRSPYPGMAGFSHIDRLMDAGFQVVGMPSCSSCCNAARNEINHVSAFANISAFAKELRQRGCLGMVTTFWPTDATPQVRHYTKTETVDLAYRQVRPGLEAHWYNIWRGAACTWSKQPRRKEGYDRAFARAFLGTKDTSYPQALSLAGRRSAVGHIQKAQRTARRARSTVTYSGLFIRIQEHALRWEEFQNALAAIHMPKLSGAQVRRLRKLAAERAALESEFRRTYVTIYKDVHLEEEVELRFAEEQRLQDQLLADIKRRTKSLSKRR